MQSSISEAFLFEKRRSQNEEKLEALNDEEIFRLRESGNKSTNMLGNRLVLKKINDMQQRVVKN